MTTNSDTAVPSNEHILPGCLLTKKINITVVGCGATGSAIAAGLPYLHQAMLAMGHPYGLAVTFVDGDRISQANCIRQPFSESEIGLYKATVLATRINLFWGLGWRATPRFLNERWSEQTDLLIGCVDSRKARSLIVRSPIYGNCYYWLDIGNNADSGQFVLGQPDNGHARSLAFRLPTVADLFPEIIDPRLDRQDHLPSCSAVEALQRQEPFINQTLAYQALAMLSRLFRYGRLSYHGGFLNLATGKMANLAVSRTPLQQRSAKPSDH